ncbi:MAG: alpha/beta hydrolase [Deltaproteobacteria bacterium]|nr:alpha/beta hydrolase [Deltaproteobacteria bacterium]
MQTFKIGSVKANGLNFHYLEMGEGPLVLCLHGFPDHARSFRHQLPALAAAGYRVVAPYLRGYAPTENPANGPYQPAALSQDVVALIDALAGKPSLVFGHDWGAAAAYGAATIAPEKVSKLITAAVPFPSAIFSAFVTNPEQQRRSWYMFFFQMPFAEDAVALNDYAFLERIWQDWSPGWRYPAEEMASLKETFRKPGTLQAALGYYRHMLNPANHDPALAPIQEKLFTVPIDVPTLYFHGAKDGCLGLELADGMEQFFPKGLQTVVIPDAGHFVHQEKPEEVNKALLEFLAS